MILKRILLIFLVKSLYSQNTAFVNFQNYVKDPEGFRININYIQEYYGEKFESSGLFFCKDDSYTFDNIYQRITYTDSSITTINKNAKQVIYDSPSLDDVTIFDILAGKMKNVQIKDSFIDKQSNCIPFFIDKWDIQGKLWTNIINGAPKRIILNQGEEIKVEIIISLLDDSMDTDLLYYDIKNCEIIDLRE